MNRIDTIVAIINKICPFADVKSSTELIDSKIITSLTLFELILELEVEFNIRIDEELIAWENFVTPEKIQLTVFGETC